MWFLIEIHEGKTKESIYHEWLIEFHCDSRSLRKQIKCFKIEVNAKEIKWKFYLFIDPLHNILRIKALFKQEQKTIQELSNK